MNKGAIRNQGSAGMRVAFRIEPKTFPRLIWKPISVEKHHRGRMSTDFPSNSLAKSTCESGANFEKTFVETAIDQHGEHASYSIKTNVPAMVAKKQTRQNNAQSRLNHQRKHHLKATCTELFSAPVSTPISVPQSVQNQPKSPHFDPDRSTWVVLAYQLALLGRS